LRVGKGRRSLNAGLEYYTNPYQATIRHHKPFFNLPALALSLHSPAQSGGDYGAVSLKRGFARFFTQKSKIKTQKSKLSPPPHAIHPSP
jgi:hypothetical protein